jgi:hypothetical protein
MKLARHLHFVILLLPFLGDSCLSTAPRAQGGPFTEQGPEPANGVYYDCVVVERLHLTKEGYRPSRIPDTGLAGRRHLTIDRRTGEVRGAFTRLTMGAHQGDQDVTQLQCLHDKGVCCRWYARKRSHPKSYARRDAVCFNRPADHP